MAENASDGIALNAGVGPDLAHRNQERNDRAAAVALHRYRAAMGDRSERAKSASVLYFSRGHHSKHHMECGIFTLIHERIFHLAFFHRELSVCHCSISEVRIKEFMALFFI